VIHGHQLLVIAYDYQLFRVSSIEIALAIEGLVHRLSIPLKRLQSMHSVAHDRNLQAMSPVDHQIHLDR
jgi:hypothetical protein